MRGVLHYIEQDIGKDGLATTWIFWDWIVFGYWIAA